MKYLALLSIVLLGGISAGCATASVFDQQFTAGEYLEVVRMFEADSALQVQERALYQAGLVYSLPGSATYDPEVALETLDRLLTLYPSGTYAQHTLHVRELLEEVLVTQEREVQRRAELAKLNARIEWLRQEAHELREALSDEADRADANKTTADRLLLEIRLKDNQIRALQEEIAGLKEIDLNRGEDRRP